MPRTPFLIAAALLPVAAASAEPAITPNGGLAGRSPHIVFRQVAADRPACGPAMHSLPAGKDYVFGRHALPGGACGAAASHDGSATVAASD